MKKIIFLIFIFFIFMSCGEMPQNSEIENSENDIVEIKNGKDGEDGISLIWLGSFENDPEECTSDIINSAYNNLTDGNSYICDGEFWNILVTGLSPLSDTIEPVILDSNLIVSNITSNSLSISWIGAEDDIDDKFNLEYFLVYSLENNIDTVENILLNGQIIMSGNFTNWVVTDLNPSTNYFFNVLVIDSSRNKNSYYYISRETLKPFYNIRDIGPAGGYVFYDKGYYSNGWRFLEVTPTDQSSGAEWGCYGTDLQGGEGTVIGSGEQNTFEIVDDCSDYTPAEISDELVLNGFDDWFLPSKDELIEMCWNLQGVRYKEETFETENNPEVSEPLGNFLGHYWSSSEVSSSSAIYVNFSSGVYSPAEKDMEKYIRPVRAF